MHSLNNTPVIPADQLVVFIGYADDAAKEAEVVYALEHAVQRELLRLREAKAPIPYTSVQFWKWDKDSSSEVGGQRTLIDPYIVQAQVAVFVFKDRVGKVTWEEMELCRSAIPHKFVMAFFPVSFSDPTRMARDEEYIDGWSDLRKKKRILTSDWTANDSLSIRPCADYSNADSLKNIAMERFKDVLTKLASASRIVETIPVEHRADDSRRYLEWLGKECGDIKIRGLQVSGNKAHRFDIEDLYTPLYTVGGEPDDKGNKRAAYDMQHRKINLDEVLQSKHTVIVGDPGSGKSTFLRHVTAILCRTLLGVKPASAKDKLGLDKAPLPLFIRISELAAHIIKCDKRECPDAPKNDRAAEWVIHYLADHSRTENWNLNAEFFREQCTSGKALLLLDGLDEAPGRIARERISAIIDHAIRSFDTCKFIVSTRQGGYEGEALLDTFTHCTIAPLEEQGIRIFLTRWSGELYQGDERRALEHAEELVRAVNSKPEIRRMAVNPVMLTALAVLYWNDKRLPDQRAELYESIITWLLRSRQDNPGRIINEDLSRRAHQRLAYCMQSFEGGRKRAIDKADAYAAVTPLMAGDTERDKLEHARRFIDDEEVNSGIIVSRGPSIEFWHLTFQEYLAAKELSGMSDEEQKKALFANPDKTVHNSEWRETLLLFVGVMYKVGTGRLNAFFAAMLDKASEAANNAADGERLAVQARCFGLMGAMVRDLSAYGYTVEDKRYANLRDEVMGIFDPARVERIDGKIRCAAGDALGQAGDPRIWDDLESPGAVEEMFVDVPAGEFLMGAQKTDNTKENYDKDAYSAGNEPSDESPVRLVRMNGFRICRYPVTVSQYRRFVENGGYNKEDIWHAGGFGKWEEPDEWSGQIQFPNRPVVGVSWFEAMAFCMWAGLSLPTEAQWERSVRGPGQEYRKYPWGNEPVDTQRANYNKTEINHPSPVGCFPFGNVVWDEEKGLWLADMAGNVWEWCQDWYWEYLDDEVNDPAGPQNGEYRVLRGGSWVNVDDGLRCAYRARRGPVNRADSFGFRCVCSRY